MLNARRLRFGINVREQSLAATGDGIGDDSLAIQTAIDACRARSSSEFPSEGGCVYLPSGHYRISKPLLLPSGVQLLGEGDHCTFIEKVGNEVASVKYHHGGENPVLDVDAIVYITSARPGETQVGDSPSSSSERVGMSGLTLVGNQGLRREAPYNFDDSQAAWTKYAVFAPAVQESTLQDLRMIGCINGIYSTSQFWGSVLQRVRVQICVRGFVFCKSTSLSLVSCNASTFRDRGFKLENAFYTALTSCATDWGGITELTGDMGNVQSIAYHITNDSTGVSLTSCGSENQRGTAVHIDDGCAAISVHGCRFAPMFRDEGNSDYSALVVADVEGVSVTANYFEMDPRGRPDRLLRSMLIRDVINTDVSFNVFRLTGGAPWPSKRAFSDRAPGRKPQSRPPRPASD